MIKIIENLQTEDYVFDNNKKLVHNTEAENVQNVIDEILAPLSNNIKVQNVDSTDMPYEFDLYIEYEIEPGLNEYIGMWEIQCDQEGISNYSAYLSNISDEIDAAVSGFLEDYNKDI